MGVQQRRGWMLSLYVPGGGQETEQAVAMIFEKPWGTARESNICCRRPIADFCFFFFVLLAFAVAPASAVVGANCCTVAMTFSSETQKIKQDSEMGLPIRGSTIYCLRQRFRPLSRGPTGTATKMPFSHQFLCGPNERVRVY